MASIAKLQTQVEISSPADKFWDAYRTRSHIVPKANSDNIHGVEVHDGDFNSTSAVKKWTYCLDGKFQVMKGKIEVDEGNKVVTSTILEGDVLNIYKSFKTVQKTRAAWSHGLGNMRKPVKMRGIQINSWI
uniref:MLP-like protein 43 n=1 Tax=Rhizophora mucronata TaxID=61149 RepID=A0A2P2N0C5_RHIMU